MTESSVNELHIKSEPEDLLDDSGHHTSTSSRSSLYSPSTSEDSSSDDEPEPKRLATDEGREPRRIFGEDGETYCECVRCHKWIKSGMLVQHMKQHDSLKQRIECPVDNCHKRFTRINNMYRHLKVVHRSKKPYVCKYQSCSEAFAKAGQLRSHHSKHKEQRRLESCSQEAVKNEARFRCDYPGCDREYGKRHHLREHERKHTGDMRYSCSVCPKRFFVQAHLKRHLYSHTGVKPHECRWKCGAIFASYGGRMKHERINHYEQNPLQTECEICGRPFNNQHQLSRHRMTHLSPEERQDFRCSFCGIMLDSMKLKQRHEKRHRDGETFCCDTCHRCFKNEKNLMHHIKHHHPATADRKPGKKSSSVSDGNKPKPQKHPCHICGPPKLFCLTSLRRHLARIHTQNFKCPRQGCQKCFQEKSQFDAHQHIHQMRECHICHKTFQRKQNADIHLMGVHHLTTQDLKQLGRWKCKSNDSCPDYLLRSTKHKQSRKPTSTGLEDDDEQEEEEEVGVDDIIEIKSEVMDDDGRFVDS